VGLVGASLYANPRAHFDCIRDSHQHQHALTTHTTTAAATNQKPQELASWRRARAEEHDKEIVLDVETAAKVGGGGVDD
jgi:hypothetical protein